MSDAEMTFKPIGASSEFTGVASVHEMGNDTKVLTGTQLVSRGLPFHVPRIMHGAH